VARDIFARDRWFLRNWDSSYASMAGFGWLNGKEQKRGTGGSESDIRNWRQGPDEDKRGNSMQQENESRQEGCPSPLPTS
jgi:hypothetical protein